MPTISLSVAWSSTDKTACPSCHCSAWPSCPLHHSNRSLCSWSAPHPCSKFPAFMTYLFLGACFFLKKTHE